MKKLISITLLMLSLAVSFTSCKSADCEHVWKSVTTEPTCTENGFTLKVCTICNKGVSENETEAFGHNWSIVTNPPTCTSGGYDTKTCSVCGEVVIEEKNALGHKWTVVTTEPTCTEVGFDTKTCFNCGEVVIENEAEQLGHSFGTAYTYDENNHWHNCARCDEIKDFETHVYVQDMVCFTCWAVNPDAPPASQGLKFTSNGDGTCYVSGIGTCTDTDIVIPPISSRGEKVTKIDDEAFRLCNSITSVVIPETVTSIGNHAFQNCYSLKFINISDNLTTIGNGAFSGCQSLTSIDIPDKVTTIGSDVFSSCSSLSSVVLGKSVTNIGNGAFSSCYSLESLFIGDSVTTIGYSAFSNCGQLANIYISENNQSFKDIDGNVYSKDGKTLIRYAIGKKDNTFFIPECVTDISAEAFSFSSWLTSIVIPDNVISISEEAFLYCDSLQSVVIGVGVTSIASNAFEYCSSLTTITVSDENQCYKDIDGNLYSKDGKTFLRYAQGKTNTTFVIPDCVSIIGEMAFHGCTSLVIVEIPDSVTAIGDQAFICCDSLGSIVIGNGVTIIGYSAFYYCFSMNSVVIGGGVTRIYDCAFDRCLALTDVYYTGSVEEWRTILVNAGNTYLGTATIHFNYTTEN